MAAPNLSLYDKFWWNPYISGSGSFKQLNAGGVMFKLLLVSLSFKFRQEYLMIFVVRWMMKASS